jgi:hypothetical protein
MRTDALKRILLVAFAAVVTVSCEDTGTGIVDPGPLPLGTGQWFLNTADDSVLGSTIAQRTVGVALERTVVDSGSLFINADGAYEQRYWLRIFVTDVLDREETVIDIGTWAAIGSSFTFTSSVRTRTFTVTPAIDDRLFTAEPMVFWADPPQTEGLYRRTRP